jgi:cobalt-zinc-cadmium efflux system outer membrane protein
MGVSQARFDLRARKTPMADRIFSLAVLLVLASGGRAVAGTLTEDDVVRLARERDPEVALARAAVTVAGAEALRASLYPDPSLAWDRETLSGAGGEREDSFRLTVPIEVSGRRRAGRALAHAEVAGAEALAARAESDAVVASLLLFYDAIAADRRVEIAARTVARLDEAARVLGRRHAEGTSSGYESTRLELEAELARSELRQAEARAAAARAELALVLGLEPSPGQAQEPGPGQEHVQAPAQGSPAGLVLSGSLAIRDPGARADAERRSSSLLRASAARARDARDAARWAWVPLVSLSAGLRVAEADETRYGYVAGVSVDLPLFSRGRDVRAEAGAAEQRALAQVAAAERAATRAELAAEQALALAQGELARFEQATGDRLQTLERAAESGYREGVRSIVELVDAQRARTSVELRQLELALAAKRAEIELRAARGEFE